MERLLQAQATFGDDVNATWMEAQDAYMMGMNETMANQASIMNFTEAAIMDAQAKFGAEVKKAMLDAQTTWGQVRPQLEKDAQMILEQAMQEAMLVQQMMETNYNTSATEIEMMATQAASQVEMMAG